MTLILSHTFQQKQRADSAFKNKLKLQKSAHKHRGHRPLKDLNQSIRRSEEAVDDGG